MLSTGYRNTTTPRRRPPDVIHPAIICYTTRTSPIDINNRSPVLPQTSSRAYAQLPAPSKLKRDNSFRYNTPLKRPRSMVPIPYTSWSYPSPRAPNAATNIKLIHSSGTSSSNAPSLILIPSVTSGSVTRDSRGRVRFHNLASRSTASPSRSPNGNVPLCAAPLSTSSSDTFQLSYHERIQNEINTVPSSAEWLSGAPPSSVQTDIGAKYKELILRLVRLESTQGFATRCMSRLRNDGRPQKTTKWISNARGRRGTVIEILNLSEYTTNWWNRWTSFQPI